MGVCHSYPKVESITTRLVATESVKDPHDTDEVLRYGDDIDIPRIESMVHPLIISDEGLRSIMDIMHQNMLKGLGLRTNRTAKMKMFPSYVRHVPDGTEKGDYLVLDLGCTKFRMLLVRLDGAELTMESQNFSMPQKIMLGSGDQLFEHIVDCIVQFIEEHKLQLQYLPLGFTVAFPCMQTGLDRAVLTAWTKGYKCHGVIGQDLVKMLNDAIQRRGDVNVKCIAVTNDTVGTLMSGAHTDPNCAIGVVLDSGCNAAYMERLEEVECWDGDQDEPKQVIINMEWGAFGDDGCLDPFRTSIDKNVDKYSLNPGKQTFEKMSAGIYMGEIVRLVLAQLAKAKLVFQDVDAPVLLNRGRFFTKFLSRIETDVGGDITNTQEVFDDLEIQDYSAEDCRITQYVCAVVSRRCAHLMAAGIATLINHMDRPTVTIGIDGSLYRSHPRLHKLIVDKIGHLINPKLQFSVIPARDGSGIGAAIITAVVNKSLTNP